MFGTDHILKSMMKRKVPEPAYITGRELTLQESTFRGKIQLGGDQEQGVRAAAALARDVRDFAGSLAKVRRNL